MNGKELREALKSGTRVYGTNILSPMAIWPQKLEGLGMDFVFIDTEHVGIDRHQLSWMCRTYRAMNIAPIVRIPAPDPYQATMALDGGACGIIAPYVETVEQVQALRGAIKLRPLKGKTLQNILDGNDERNDELKSYMEEKQNSQLLIINIESVPAIEALDDILKVPDLDAVLIGPHDLSCSLGVPEDYRHPKFDQAVREILQKARAAGIGAGLHYWAGMDQQIAWAKEAGLNFIIHKSDLIFVVDGLRQELGALKRELGDFKESKAESVNI